MLIDRCIVGPLQANCYLLADPDSQQAVIIDPGDEADVIVQMIAQYEAQVTAILCTHGHPDHIGAAGAVAEMLGINKVYLHPAEIGMLSELMPAKLGQNRDSLLQEYEEGQRVTVGELAAKVIHTPGHSAGSVCLAVEQVLFTGDTLFAGGVGRTDLPGGDHSALQASLKRIVDQFSPETAIYPGHGPTSTLGDECETNPWIAEVI